jgi:hypothetical protein
MERTEEESQRNELDSVECLKSETESGLKAEISARNDKLGK